MSVGQCLQTADSDIVISESVSRAHFEAQTRVAAVTGSAVSVDETSAHCYLKTTR